LIAAKMNMNNTKKLQNIPRSTINVKKLFIKVRYDTFEILLKNRSYTCPDNPSPIPIGLSAKIWAEPARTLNRFNTDLSGLTTHENNRGQCTNNGS